MNSKWKFELPAAGLFIVAIGLGLLGKDNAGKMTVDIQPEEPEQ